MNVSNEFQEIGILLTQDRLVSVLEEMPVPPVAQIKGNRIAGQQPAHQSRDRSSSCSQKEVKMVWKKRPGVAGAFCSLEIGGKPLQKIIAVLIIEEYFSPLNPPPYNVVKGSRDIDP